MLVHKYFVRPIGEESERAALRQIQLGHEYHNRIVLNSECWYARKKSGHEIDKAQRNASSRADRAHFSKLGLHYGTYMLVEAASKKARHPHPRRCWDEGRAGAPIPTSGPSKGVPCDDAHRPCLDVTDGIAALKLGAVRTRWSIHSKQLAQRPLPAGGLIVQAWVQRERSSTQLLDHPRYRWFLVLVIDRVSPASHDVPAHRTAAGLDIAWRQDPDSPTLRVAYIADDAGRCQSITMPARQYSRLQHSKSLAEIADRECANPMRSELGVPSNTGHRRLLELAPEDIRAKQLVHLLEWHHGARQNALASRDAHYLSEIHRLCLAHHTIYIEQIKGVARMTGRRKTVRDKTGDSSAEGAPARGQRQVTAPFSFLRRLQAEAPKFGTLIVEVDPAYTSRDCLCGVDMGPSSVRERRCDACGRSWDVDHLAALNLLRRGTARNPVTEAAE